MPTIPTKWRKYLYGVSMPAIGLLQVFGLITGEVAAQIGALAFAVFIGGLAFTNTHPTGDEVQDPRE